MGVGQKEKESLITPNASIDGGMKQIQNRISIINPAESGLVRISGSPDMRRETERNGAEKKGWARVYNCGMFCMCKILPHGSELAYRFVTDCFLRTCESSGFGLQN